MRLKPFLLDLWLDKYEHTIQYNVGSSTGPVWTLNEILALGTDEQRDRFFNHKVLYSRPAGADGLRAAIADFHGVTADAVQVVTGASEALLVLMWMAAEPSANVVLPRPGFPTFSALPESLGIEVRHYDINRSNNFSIDVDAIKSRVDNKTKLVLVNSPHNPTGAMISDADLDDLHAFTSTRGIQLVIDEVYHPIHHGNATRSASRLPHATVIHDFSKAFSLSGVRTGWMIDHDAKRREQYWNARTYFTITNASAAEILAEIAMQKRDVILKKTQDNASTNLRRLEAFMAEHSDTLGWVRPQGGMTAFPWLRSGEDEKPFCEAAAEGGVLFAPGYCFDVPGHFRFGFGAATEQNFGKALERLGALVNNWSVKTVSA